MGKTASVFSTGTSYAIGDLTMYNGILYVFTSAHSGAWDDDDAKMYDDTTMFDINRILEGYQNAQAAVAQAASVVFEPENITGERYKYKLTNANYH